MNHSTQNKNETPAHMAKQEMGWNEGRIVFTNSKDLVGVGLPRKGSRTTPKTCITTPEGKTKDGNHGWEDLYKEGEFLVPDGTKVEMTVTDDTLPGGQRQVTRTFIAPFARANREEDYRIAWAFFENGMNPTSGGAHDSQK